MRASLTLLFLFSTLILSAQIQNGGLDQWEEAFHPTHPYFDLVEWKTSNRGSSTPTIDPTPDTSVTKIIQNGRIFAKIESNQPGQDAIMAGWISQKFSGQNLKSINYTSRCDSIHLLGRCLVQIYGGNSTTLIYSDSTFITSDIFEEKTINIDPAWTQNNDSLTIRFIADGYNFPLQPKMEGYAIFSIDEVDINYITSTENNILDKNALDISPNPSAGIFNLKLDESFQPTSIQVYNIIGQEILDRKYTSQINLSDLDSGTYIISVQTKLGVLSNKITLW